MIRFLRFVQNLAAQIDNLLRLGSVQHSRQDVGHLRGIDDHAFFSQLVDKPHLGLSTALKPLPDGAGHDFYSFLPY